MAVFDCLGSDCIDCPAHEMTSLAKHLLLIPVNREWITPTRQSWTFIDHPSAPQPICDEKRFVLYAFF